jgi:hypothetical protein
MMKLRCALAGVLLVHGALASAKAEPPEQVPGRWFGRPDRFGLLFAADDVHPYFAFGQCDRTQAGRPRAQLQLDVDPKVLGDVLTGEKYIVMQWSDGHSTGNLIVDHLELNEFGPYLWAPSIAVGLEALDRWRTAPHLELTVGVGEIKGQAFPFAPRKTYILPDDNRQDALASFIRSCSGQS